MILLMAGGTGMGPLAEVVREAAEAVGDSAELVVVCGRNEKLLESVRRIAAHLPASVRVHGFVEDMKTLLQAASVVVTKPGGLTTSECLALGKPLVFYVAAPGQESANARFCVDRGAAIDGVSPRGAALAAARLLRESWTRERLARRARRISRPGAALEIARVVLSRLPVGAPLVAALETGLGERHRGPAVFTA